MAATSENCNPRYPRIGMTRWQAARLAYDDVSGTRLREILAFPQGLAGFLLWIEKAPCNS